MSLSNFYKIPFEGKAEAINELIKSRDWNLSIKFPEKGIIFMKVPIDIDEEVAFNQNLVIDDETQTKLGSFSQITQEEYEQANNMENVDSSNPTENKESEEKKEESSPKKNVQIHKSKTNKEFSELFDESKSKNKNEYKKTSSFLGKINFSVPSINFKELGKEINAKYKDPYDYFFTQKYLIAFFIFAVICLIIFRF